MNNNLLKTVLLVAFGFYLTSCEVYLGTGCVGCHTDRERLEEIAAQEAALRAEIAESGASAITCYSRKKIF